MERFQWKSVWNFVYAKFQRVSCLRHSHFCDNVSQSLSIEQNGPGKNNLVLENPGEVFEFYV